MPWIVAKKPLRCGMSPLLLPGGRLPGWAQTASMIRVLKSLRGSGCVTWREDGPICPVPRGDAAPSPLPAAPLTLEEKANG